MGMPVPPLTSLARHRMADACAYCGSAFPDSVTRCDSCGAPRQAHRPKLVKVMTVTVVDTLSRREPQTGPVPTVRDV
jgi:uncharacterized OB-fold protein